MNSDTPMNPPSDFCDTVRWNAQGLVPAVAQDAQSGRVLMVAWMDAEALRLTAREGRAVYYSRSRQRLWHKGEQSGHVQLVRTIRLDCDRDVVLLGVEQIGGIACHTGRESCFFLQLGDTGWSEIDTVLKPPEQIYGSGHE